MTLLPIKNAGFLITRSGAVSSLSIEITSGIVGLSTALSSMHERATWMNLINWCVGHESFKVGSIRSGIFFKKIALHSILRRQVTTEINTNEEAIVILINNVDFFFRKSIVTFLENLQVVGKIYSTYYILFFMKIKDQCGRFSSNLKNNI